MPRRVFCKYFGRGTCLKGESCNFSHDWRHQPNKVCTFYQKGLCNYGPSCRYNHVIVSGHETSVAVSSESCSQIESSSSQDAFPSRDLRNRDTSQAFTIPTVLPTSSQSHTPHEGAQNQAISSNVDIHVSAHSRPSDLPLCSFNHVGSCPHGENCHRIHGELCSICGKHCLHPFRQEERDKHIESCQRNKEVLETLKYSKEIECSICLERVLSKPTITQRKFGILPECDHPFCIECIRNWRSNSPSSGIDLNTALRACPVCRQHSYFVIPSTTWFSTSEEKQEIIDNYKRKLKSIDCKYFDFGNGTCPFGAICFYKHTIRPNASRRNPDRSNRDRPRPYRSRQLVEEVDRLVTNYELANLASMLDLDEELEDLANDDDLGDLLAMSFFLMHMDEEGTSDEDI
ncbi:E3 ubiquitin-protein ligase makorin-like isoform X1 [Zingiber officinale]|uniref:E3 ubiquitin-protein ligase makorin-like isoform X1 n=1 Tax=Zingiber officinale TaxID=94328 RepID=UPI001C4D9133|nr:E3 ubiquitin-protein ligase makorin-like isoform X1 [Zingiber officinale]